jgi:hypothetical protein
VEAVARQAPVDDLYPRNLDDAVALRDFQTGGFGIQDDLSRHRC